MDKSKSRYVTTAILVVFAGVMVVNVLFGGLVSSYSSSHQTEILVILASFLIVGTVVLAALILSFGYANNVKHA